MSDFRAGRNPLTKDSARDGETSGRPTGKEAPLPAPATITESLDAVERMRIEMGATPADLIGGYIQDARESLMEAMKRADRLGATDEHRRVGHLVLSVDDFLAVLAERGRGS